MFKLRQLKFEIPPEPQSLLECAAELEGRTVSEFVAEVLRRQAHAVPADVDVNQLTEADQGAIAEAWITHLPPNATLIRAFARNKKLFR